MKPTYEELQSTITSLELEVGRMRKSLDRIAHNGWDGHWAGDSYEEAREALSTTPIKSIEVLKKVHHKLSELSKGNVGNYAKYAKSALVLIEELL